MPLINYDNKKSNFDSDTFRKLLKLYKIIYPGRKPDFVGNALQDGLIVFNNITFGDPRVESIAGMGLDEPIVAGFPTLSGVQKDYVIHNDCIAVNSNCKNKDIAFKYVKIVASYEMQKCSDSRGLYYNNVLASPVNDRSYKDDLLSLPIAKAAPKFVEDLLKRRGNLEECLVKEYNLRQMADELALEYVKGSKTIDQVVKEMNDKVNVFLNE